MNNKEGYFGNFGGRFVPEALRPPLMELEQAMDTIMQSRRTGMHCRICWSTTRQGNAPDVLPPPLGETGLPPVAEA